jgi:hypothetical protein
MKRSVVLVLCSAIIGVLAFSAPVAAKTAKECQTEWRAHKAANQAKGISEKSYVEKCRSAEKATQSKTTKSSEKKSSNEKMTKEKKTKKEETKKSAGKEKTVKACQAEWRANKKANQAKGITEKAYVEKCRSGSAMMEPKAMPASSSTMKKETSAPETKEKMSRSKPGMGKPSGADQYTTESQAKSHCSRGTVVWANLDSKIYHFAGTGDYGHTKSGAYMCEKDAMSQGLRAAKNEKHP